MAYENLEKKYEKTFRKIGLLNKETEINLEKEKKKSGLLGLLK